MHRYTAVGGSGGVGSNQGSGGGTSRETRGSDSSFTSSSSYPLGARRAVAAPLLVAYKLKCEREPLSSRFGPPDFYPPAANCPEEVLNRDSCVNGYKELVDGIEEGNEAKLSLTSQNNLWNKPSVNKYRDAIRKRLRVLNNTRIRKRKAGQVYGVPLTGALLGKPGLFPELRTCGEDLKKKWIEDLSQRKRLRSLAEHVPHGYRRRTLFEALIKHDVPLLRATWFIKIIYLNQGRPMSAGINAGGPDKSLAKRVELWTRELLDYAQSVLEELCQSSSGTSRHSSQQSLLTGSQRQVGDGGRGSVDVGEAELQGKWRYVVRLAQWHHSEGLIHRAQLVDWVMKQLQERDSVKSLELLLPVILKLIDEISSSQTHVRALVQIALHWLRDLCPSSGVVLNLVEQPHLLYSVISLTDLVRYLLLIVPDTFVALDCFPLPLCVCPEQPKEGALPFSVSTRIGETKESRPLKPGSDSGDDRREAGKEEVPNLSGFGKPLKERELIIVDVVDGIQRRAASLTKAVNPGLLRNNEGKVVQGLDKALIGGDIQGARNCVFDEDFCSSDQLPDEWQADVITGFGRTPSLLSNVNSSELFAIRFLCEWAVCEFRDSRGVPTSRDRKPTAVTDMSRVYMAVSVLRLRMEELKERKATSDDLSDSAGKMDSMLFNGELNAPVSSFTKRSQSRDGYAGNTSGPLRSQVSVLVRARQAGPDFCASPGPLHDLIVAWLDQHEHRRRESSERLHLLLAELVRVGLFWPDAYVRQLLCSGVLERNKTTADVSRAARHKFLLQHLPGPPQLEGSVEPSLLEAARQYQNERHLALHGFNLRKINRRDGKFGARPAVSQQQPDANVSQLEAWVNNTREHQLVVGASEDRTPGMKNKKPIVRLAELKQAITLCLQFPDGSVGHVGTLSERVNQKGITRQAASPGNSMDKPESTPGCEECSRSKRMKTNDGKAWNAQALLPALLDEDDAWWLRKGQKVLDAVKVDPPVKPAGKQNSRGRPKTVRKTQSLAQLASARIEGSQGASSSHMCDTRVHCPYHRSPPDGTSSSQVRDRTKQLSGNSIHAIGSTIRCLRLKEKRSLSCWLDKVVRGLLSGGGNGPPMSGNNLASVVLTSAPLTAGDGGNAVRWKINEEQLAMIVYILDIALDFHALVQFLLYLLPMAPAPHSMTPGHGSRGISSSTWNRDNFMCEVGEASLLSYLRRYEGVLAAMDLLPQALRAAMDRAANLMPAVPSGRAGYSALLYYACDLLRKYGGLESVQMWEKNWKSTYDDTRLGTELEALKKPGDSEGGYGAVSLPSSGVGDDRDDPIPPRLTGRLTRVGVNMREIVQRNMNEAVAQMINKERDSAASSGLRDGVLDRWEEGHQTAQRVAGGIMDAIKQNGNGAPQGDSALVAAAVGLVVGSAGTTVANVFETLGASNHMGVGPSGLESSLRCARQTLHMHMVCLRLLKEALGDRHSRMLEVALATEANSVVVVAMQHPSGRAPRTQFRSSPETPENFALASDFGVGANLLGRANVSAAGVASFVAGVAVQGITSLERMVTVLKMRDNLETLQISKTGSASASGISRSSTGSSNLKDHVAEAHVYWFRVLIGDCRMVCGGLVADLLGEANVLGLARMQRAMPLTTVFSPAYALFAAALRRQSPTFLNSTVREDPVLHAAINAVNDVVAHEPFRDVCLRDTQALNLLLSSDSGESEYAATLDAQGLDGLSKGVAMVPLRARLFLHSVLDRCLPPCLLQDEEAWGQGRVDAKNRFANEPRQIEQLVQVLDDLQPATYHWQVVELRLLLNEQVFMEKLDHTGSAVEAMQLASAGSDTRQLSECEKTFTEVVLTRLLVRPDAAALYSEAVHSLGRPLEDYLILQVKWVLEGNDMLVGRKSLHQLLDIIANREGFSIKTQRIKMWGWQPARHVGDGRLSLGSEEKKLAETASPEEGELADGADFGKEGRLGTVQEALCSQQFATEKALADLVLPCLARSSNDTCSSFAFELIKQMSKLEEQITLLARSNAKSMLTSASGGEVLSAKGTGQRRGTRGGLEAGSPGIGRKLVVPTPDPLLSAGGLRTSMWLRLQFLLPLLPIIHIDREQTARNMRQSLAPVLLRLLGTRVVQEPVESFHSVSARDLDRNAEASSVAATSAAGEGLFDRLLSVLHALLSSNWAVWLKPRPTTKGTSKSLREVPPFDRETAERMQAELEHMQLPRAVRARLQAALPLVPLSPPLTISAGPPQVSTSVGSNSLTSSILGPSGASHKLLMSVENNLGKAKPTFLSEPEVEVDPWTLLEDGVGSTTAAGSVGMVTGEVGNLKACSWLKGAVRVKRSDLTYVGAVDEDS